MTSSDISSYIFLLIGQYIKSNYGRKLQFYHRNFYAINIIEAIYDARAANYDAGVVIQHCHFLPKL